MGLKPGWKTSEFWIVLMTSVVNLTTMSGVFTTNEANELYQAAPIIGQAIITVGYAIARARTKSD